MKYSFKRKGNRVFKLKMICNTKIYSISIRKENIQWFDFVYLLKSSATDSMWHKVSFYNE